jgi:hypothetical protein
MQSGQREGVSKSIGKNFLGNQNASLTFFYSLMSYAIKRPTWIESPKNHDKTTTFPPELEMTWTIYQPPPEDAWNSLAKVLDFTAVETGVGWIVVRTLMWIWNLVRGRNNVAVVADVERRGHGGFDSRMSALLNAWNIFAKLLYKLRFCWFKGKLPLKIM